MMLAVYLGIAWGRRARRGGRAAVRVGAVGESVVTIHVGFTGTRHGMTPPQQRAVRIVLGLLRQCDELTAHHGDCVGADAEFDAVARDIGARIIVHPGRSVRGGEESYRAFCRGDEILTPLGHFARNREIVAESDVMIATPYEATRQERGGTWYTIDRAERSGKPLAIVLPTRDGVRVAYSGARWPEPP